MNPFKMAGSWIGTIIGGIIGYILYALSSYACIFNDTRAPCSGNISFIIFGIIIGFLLGYGIHSWIRKAKK